MVKRCGYKVRLNQKDSAMGTNFTHSIRLSTVFRSIDSRNPSVHMQESSHSRLKKPTDSRVQYVLTLLAELSSAIPGDNMSDYDLLIDNGAILARDMSKIR
jgi:hypothetical protein